MPSEEPGVPLTVRLDLEHGYSGSYPGCTCIRDSWSLWMRANEGNPCRHHTTIEHLKSSDHARRIRTLDVHLALIRDDLPGDEYFADVLNDLGLFTSPYPSLKVSAFA